MMNPFILSIETSTDACSVALSRGTELVGANILEEARQQAAMLAPMIDNLISEADVSLKSIDAVAVSEGPGSYTGLRVGASTAKGICFGAKKPLIAVSTMDILFAQALKLGCDFVVPVIDARRMEVYQAIYNSKGERITPQEPKVIDADSYHELLDKGTVVFVGTGAAKMAEVIVNDNASFLQCAPIASYMINIAAKAFDNSEFRDVAYFEPFYLKDFVAGVTKKDPLKW